MKQELFTRAKDSYLNAILFYQAGRKDDFYRYLGAGEAYESVLRMQYGVTKEEDERLVALTDVCDAYDDAE